MGIEEFLLDRVKKEGRKEGQKREEKRECALTTENLLKRGMFIQEVREITTSKFYSFSITY